MLALRCWRIFRGFGAIWLNRYFWRMFRSFFFSGAGGGETTAENAKFLKHSSNSGFLGQTVRNIRSKSVWGYGCVLSGAALCLWTVREGVATGPELLVAGIRCNGHRSTWSLDRTELDFDGFETHLRQSLRPKLFGGLMHTEAWVNDGGGCKLILQTPAMTMVQSKVQMD